MANGTLFLIIVFAAFFFFGLFGWKESKVGCGTYWIALFVVGFILWIIWSAHAPIIPGGH